VFVIRETAFQKLQALEFTTVERSPAFFGGGFLRLNYPYPLGPLFLRALRDSLAFNLCGFLEIFLLYCSTISLGDRLNFVIL